MVPGRRGNLPGKEGEKMLLRDHREHQPVSRFTYESGVAGVLVRVDLSRKQVILVPLFQLKL